MFHSTVLFVIIRRMCVSNCTIFDCFLFWLGDHFSTKNRYESRIFLYIQRWFVNGRITAFLRQSRHDFLLNACFSRLYAEIFLKKSREMLYFQKGYRGDRAAIRASTFTSDVISWINHFYCIIMHWSTVYAKVMQSLLHGFSMWNPPRKIFLFLARKMAFLWHGI